MSGWRRLKDMTGTALWGAAGGLIYVDIFGGHEEYRTGWMVLSFAGIGLWAVSGLKGRHYEDVEHG